MLYLILAILSSTLISVGMRIGKKYSHNQMGMFTVNYLLCILLSCAYMERKPMETDGAGLWMMVILGLITGILYLAGFLFLNWNIRNNGVVLSATFSKLGVLIPTLMAIIVFRETPQWTQILGILLSLAAIVILHFDSESATSAEAAANTNASTQKSRNYKKLFLFFLLIQTGLNDSMSNIFEQLGDPVTKNGYLLITFGTAFLLALLCAIFGRQKVTKYDILFGLLVGLPNYYSARFLLLSLGQLSAVIVFPMYSVATIICITAAGVVMFREKISKKKWIALAVIVAALCLLNL